MIAISYPGDEGGDFVTYGPFEDGGGGDVVTQAFPEGGYDPGGVTTFALGEEGGAPWEPSQEMDTFDVINFVVNADYNGDGTMDQQEQDYEIYQLEQYNNQLSTFLNFSPNNDVYVQALKFYISKQLKIGDFVSEYKQVFDQSGGNPNDTVNPGDVLRVAQRDGNMETLNTVSDRMRTTRRYPSFIDTWQNPLAGSKPPQAMTTVYTGPLPYLANNSSQSPYRQLF